MSKIANIDYRFKILYAVAILMVVCGHAGDGGISIISDWFPYGGLHLAMFAFSSGYFYKKNSETAVIRYLFKKLKTLILPLYIYTIIYGLIVQISRLKGFEIGGDFTLYNIIIAPITNGHQFSYNMGGWFVVPLFMVEAYNILIRKLASIFKKEISEIVFFILNISLGLLGNQLAIWGFHNDWWLVLVRMLYFLPFYGLGMFHKNILEKHEKKIPSFWYFSLIFLAKLIIVSVYGYMPVYVPSWCKNFTEGPLLPIIVGYLGIAFWMRIATILSPMIGKSKWINLIADNTYSIMMNQFLGFMIIKSVYYLFSRIFTSFTDFDYGSFKTDIWWYYVPKGINHLMIIYVIAGIAFPIFFQKLINLAKNNLDKLPIQSSRRPLVINTKKDN